MADGIELTPGAGGGPTVATDDIGGVHYARNKLVYGADGSITGGDVTTANPYPVALYPVVAGGSAFRHLVLTASTNAINVKASAGQLYAIHGFNAGQVPFFPKFHNTNGVPAAGAGVVFALTAQAGLPFSYLFPDGIPFATGLGLTVVLDLADAGTTPTAAAQGIVLVVYK